MKINTSLSSSNFYSISKHRAAYKKANPGEDIKGKDIHHINSDHFDNTPSNLHALSPEDHRAAERSLKEATQAAIRDGRIKYNRETQTYQSTKKKKKD